MKTNEISVIAEKLFATMQSDGYSQKFLDNSAWIINLFASYCERQNVQDVKIENAVQYCQEQWGVRLLQSFCQSSVQFAKAVAFSV